MTTMTGQVPGGVELATDDLSEILAEVLASLDLESVDVDPAGAGNGVSGSVTITGEWNGVVQLELDGAGQLAHASAMFMTEPEALTDDEVVDAIGELANMVGGGIKGMLPEPSRLSLPTVVHGTDLHLAFPGSTAVARFARTSRAGTVRVTVWSAP